MQRVDGEAQPLAPACVQTSRWAAKYEPPGLGDQPHPWDFAASRCCSSFTPQRKHGIEFHSAPYRSRASGKSHHDCNSDDDGEEHWLNRNLRLENRAANLVSKQRSGGESCNPAHDCKQQSLGKKYGGYCEGALAERLHHA